MVTLSQIYETVPEEIMKQNPQITDAETLALLSYTSILHEIAGENGSRDTGQKLRAPQDLPIVAIAVLISGRDDIARVVPGDRSQTNKKQNLTSEEKQNLPLGIYQKDGDNTGVWEITNDPYGAFGELVEKYKPDATRKEKLEIFDKVKKRTKVIQMCVIPYYVAVNNGIWDMKQKKLLPFTPDLVFTSKIHTNLNVNATNPVIQIPEDGSLWDFDNWLSSLGPPPFVESVKEVIQAACLPLAPRNQMCLFYSKVGNNGKGTICLLIRNLLGEEVVVNIPLNAFSAKFALADLPRATAVITDENDVSSFSKGLGKLKAAITGDTLKIEQKYQTAYDYAFHGLILECINDFPKGDDKTGSFKRRLHIIEFNNCFTGAEKRYIKDRLIHREDVLEYVLKLVLVDMDYREHFTETPETKNALRAYEIASNSVSAFLQEILPECQWDLLPATDFLYEIYKVWYRKISPSGKVIGRNDFIDSVREFVATDPDASMEWEWTDSTRSQGYINCNVCEPLVEKYELYWFWSRGLQSTGVGRCFAYEHTLKEKYSGLKRKSAKVTTNNNSN